MVRDKVIWGGCLGLFVAGGLFFLGVSGSSTSEDLKLVDWFTALSAIATAAAAFAAWKAADAAQKQSLDTSLATRRQLYTMHLEQFGVWLDAIEDEFKVKFYSRHELYEIIFPNNRNPALPFSETGSSEVLSWRSSFEKLTNRASGLEKLTLRDIEMWLFDYGSLTGHMRYTYRSAKARQVRLDKRIPTGIGDGNHKEALSVMASVVSAISKFSFCGGDVYSKSVSERFKEDFSDFLREVITRSYNNHSYSDG